MQHLKSASEELAKAAKRVNLYPVLQSPQDLVTAPSSFVARSGVLYLMIHIPLAQENPLTLHRFMHTPLLLKDGRIVIPQPQQQYLAINSAMTEFLPITGEQLAACDKVQNLHLCNLGMTFKTSKTNCLLNLYLGRANLVADTCHFSVAVDHEVLHPMGANHVIIIPHSSQAALVNVVCKNEPQITPGYNVKKPRVVEVKPGCSLSTEHAVYRPTGGNDIRVEYEVRSLFDFNFTTPMLSILAPPEAPVMNIPTAPMQIVVPAQHYNMYTVGAVLTGMSLAVCAALLIYIGAGKLKERRSRRKQAGFTNWIRTGIKRKCSGEKTETEAPPSPVRPQSRLVITPPRKPYKLRFNLPQQRNSDTPSEVPEPMELLSRSNREIYGDLPAFTRHANPELQSSSSSLLCAKLSDKVSPSE